MSARSQYPHSARFAESASGGDLELIDRRRETADLLDEVDRLRARLTSCIDDCPRCRGKEVRLVGQGELL